MAPPTAVKPKRCVPALKNPSKKNKVDKTRPLKFSFLPTEMRAMVVANMSAAGGRRLLRDFSLTSRDGRDLARKELYRDISILRVAELACLTRSLIENPPLRKLIRSVRLYADRWNVVRHQSGRDWAPIDESRLSQSDRQLLILLRSLNSNKLADDVQYVCGLFLFLVNETTHLTFDTGYYIWDLLDNFLAAGLALTSLSSPNPGTALLPAMKTLNISSKHYLRKTVQTIQGVPYHPFKTLTASPHLREFIFTGDMDKWSNLDDIDPSMRLPFTNINLVASSCTASTLSKFLRHCPDLQCLSVAPQSYNSEPDANECLNTTLTNFCPQIRELSLRNGGRSRDFFWSSATHTITCLPEMANLKELRLEVDAFFADISDSSTFRLPNKLPTQLEKLFLDCSFALTHFHTPYMRLVPSSPEAIAYKKAVHSMIQAICKAREDGFPRLNTIVIGSKWMSPVRSTKAANKALSKTGARIKIMSSTNTQRLWTCPWDAMKV
ncbi:hypothetical protein LY76DRAFT_666567 [Colletotrichum caudatum]|nr:hypothetical protein LY76DRAFT_666567 [Colletotrichum caudatum]